MENHNTHLAPGFTLNNLIAAPANMVVFQDALGPLPGGGGTQPLPNVLPAWEPPPPVWPEDPRTSLFSWGFVLLTRAPPSIKLQSF